MQHISVLNDHLRSGNPILKIAKNRLTRLVKENDPRDCDIDDAAVMIQAYLALLGIGIKLGTISKGLLGLLNKQDPKLILCRDGIQEKNALIFEQLLNKLVPVQDG